MIVSRRWLEALLNRPLEGKAIADSLARQVAPVDGVVPIHQDLRDVLIARAVADTLESLDLRYPKPDPALAGVRVE